MPMPHLSGMVNILPEAGVNFHISFMQTVLVVSFYSIYVDRPCIAYLYLCRYGEISCLHAFQFNTFIRVFCFIIFFIPISLYFRNGTIDTIIRMDMSEFNGRVAFRL